MAFQTFTGVERLELAKHVKLGKEKPVQVVNTIYSTGADRDFGVLKQDTPFLQFIRDTNLGLVPRDPGRLQTTPLLTAPDPQPLTIKPVDLRGAHGFLWRDMKDDTWGRLRRLAASLGESMQTTLEYFGHTLFNNYTDSSIAIGWDGQPLGSATHRVLNGTTYSNLLPAAAPSEALINSIFDYFESVPDDHGRPTRVTSFNMVVHHREYRAFSQLMNTKTAISVVSGATPTGPNPNPNIPSILNQDPLGYKLTPSPYLLPGLRVILGEGHQAFYWHRFGPLLSNYTRNDPPAEVYRVWWSGNVGFMDARRVLIIQPA